MCIGPEWAAALEQLRIDGLRDAAFALQQQQVLLPVELTGCEFECACRRRRLIGGAYELVNGG